MTKLNRRDIGYTIISRFEIEWREFISRQLSVFYNKPEDGIPAFILAKTKMRGSLQDDVDISFILDETDFPDLGEICIYSINCKNWFGDKITKQSFQTNVSMLYILRCKIAHVKGEFTSLDLDKLIDLSVEMSKTIGSFHVFDKLIYDIKNNPNSFTIEIPNNFFIDIPTTIGIPNNLPVADYELEGGFVGRTDDQKNINKYLISKKFPIVTITGAGGVGKTSLALKIAKEYINDSRFDAIVWLSAKENMLSPIGIEDIEPTFKSYEDMLDTIISVLGFNDEIIHVDSLDEKEKIIEMVFEITNNILVIVDNLETIHDERVRNFLIEAPINVKFLVTSRRGIGQVEIRHELVQLKEVEAISLFRQLAREKGLNDLMKLDNITIKKYVNRVSCYPLAIKWVIGQIARGKDINILIDSIQVSTSDISKFCFDQIFNDLPDHCRLILFALSCLEEAPSGAVLKYIVQLDADGFEENIEELVLVSLIVPERHQNEQNEITTKYSILSLTKSYIRYHLSQMQEIKISIEHKISSIQSTISANEKAKYEYRYSLNNLGAVTEEEKIASMFLQTATQKYLSGNFDAAVEDYKNAAGVAPRFASVYRNWAVTLSSEGRFAEAIAQIERACDLSAKDPQIWLVWGGIMSKSRRHKEALEKYESALSLSPDDIVVLVACAKMQRTLGNYDEARNLLVKAMRVQTENTSKRDEVAIYLAMADTLIDWSDVLFRNQNREKAEEYLLDSLILCKNVLLIDSNDAYAKSLMLKSNLKIAQFYKKTNRKEDSINYLDFIVKQSPFNLYSEMYIVSAYLEYCRYYIDKGDIVSASKMYSQIGESHQYVFKRFQYVHTIHTEIGKQLQNYKAEVGTIISVSEDLKSVLITSHLSNYTYTANSYSFVYHQIISDNLLNKQVRFIAQQGVQNEEIYRKAKGISFVTMN